MVLVIADEGPLGKALGEAAERRGPSRSIPTTDDDFFGSAVGSSAIVYVPAGNLLRGRLAPAPDVGRMRRVLGATQAPKVELLVVVSPPGYEEEELALRRYGVPYVILHAPPLVEELALESEVKTSRSVWLPRGRSTVVGTADAVAAAALQAVDDASLQGNTIDAPSETIDAAEAMRRAARLAGRTTIRSVPAAVDTVVCAIPRLLGLKGAPIEALHRRIALASNQALRTPASSL